MSRRREAFAWTRGRMIKIEMSRLDRWNECKD